MTTNPMDPEACAVKARYMLDVASNQSSEELVQLAQAWIALGQLEYLLLQQTPADQRKAVSDESGDTEPRQMVMVDEPRNNEGQTEKTDDPPPERRMRYVLMSRMDGKPRTAAFGTLYEAQRQMRFYDPREVAVMCRMSDDEPWEEVR